MRMQHGAVAAGVIAGAAAAGWAGLRIPAPPFADWPEPSQPLTRREPLPDTLPDPVRRWLRGVYGDTVPVIDSVVVTGRARMNPFGIWLPARFRFIHDAGRSYRHIIDGTWYGKPVLPVREEYIDGHSQMAVPMLGSDAGPQLEQAANLGMWAELAAAAPAVLVIHPGVGWRAVDETRAMLEVPFGSDDRDEFAAHFDPHSGELRELHGWRFRDSRAPDKVLWIARCEPGAKVPGTGVPAVGTATWADQGQPWARFVTEDIRFNVDVTEALRRDRR
jgi:hypothetical protein